MALAGITIRALGGAPGAIARASWCAFLGDVQGRALVLVDAVGVGPDDMCGQALESAPDRQRMERAMSLVAVPDDSEMSVCGIRTPGRQLRAASGVPVALVTDWVFGSAGLRRVDLGKKSAE